MLRIMRKYHNILDNLHVLLRDSDYSNMPRAKVAAAIVHKNKLISIGMNFKKSDPFQKMFSSNDDSIYLHAETLAIKRALKVLDEHDLQKCSLFVCRIKFDHDFNVLRGLAKPCEGCQKAIQHYNLKQTIYSLDNTLDYAVMMGD